METKHQRLFPLESRDFLKAAAANGPLHPSTVNWPESLGKSEMCCYWIDRWRYRKSRSLHSFPTLRVLLNAEKSLVAAADNVNQKLVKTARITITRISRSNRRWSSVLKRVRTFKPPLNATGKFEQRSWTPVMLTARSRFRTNTDHFWKNFFYPQPLGLRCQCSNVKPTRLLIGPRMKLKSGPFNSKYWKFLSGGLNLARYEECAVHPFYRAESGQFVANTPKHFQTFYKPGSFAPISL